MCLFPVLLAKKSPETKSGNKELVLFLACYSACHVFFLVEGCWGILSDVERIRGNCDGLASNKTIKQPLQQSGTTILRRFWDPTMLNGTTFAVVLSILVLLWSTGIYSFEDWSQIKSLSTSWQPTSCWDCHLTAADATTGPSEMRLGRTKHGRLWDTYSHTAKSAQWRNISRIDPLLEHPGGAWPRKEDVMHETWRINGSSLLLRGRLNVFSLNQIALNYVWLQLVVNRYPDSVPSALFLTYVFLYVDDVELTPLPHMVRPSFGKWAKVTINGVELRTTDFAEIWELKTLLLPPSNGWVRHPVSLPSNCWFLTRRSLFIIIPLPLLVGYNILMNFTIPVSSVVWQSPYPRHQPLLSSPHQQLSAFVWHNKSTLPVVHHRLGVCVSVSTFTLLPIQPYRLTSKPNELGFVGNWLLIILTHGHLGIMIL